MSIHQLAGSQQRPLKLAALVEPDHGVNLIASDVAYLLERLQSGIVRSQIELGGKHLTSLRADAQASIQANFSKTDAAITGGIAS
ncbi:MAG: hypothetical protein HC800_00015 [Phormidesmis sp. RL_2_1]|nr:hypothetical protein [Phormidesmis sp. RL_2_1]